VLNIGSPVEWKSQANGFSKVKEGTIVAVIPPGEAWIKYAAPFRETHVMEGGAGKTPREHESYLVSVLSQAGHKRPRLYWPRVSQLGEIVPSPSSEKS
jgi:hypothetical protein